MSACPLHYTHSTRCFLQFYPQSTDFENTSEMSHEHKAFEFYLIINTYLYIYIYLIIYYIYLIIIIYIIYLIIYICILYI